MASGGHRGRADSERATRNERPHRCKPNPFAACGLAIALAISVPVALAATRPRTTRIDLSSSEAQATGGSSFSSAGQAIAAGGGFVAFQSDATNLVANDLNGASDIFVRNLATHKTVRASVSSSGQEANGGSFTASISADGRFVAFASNATNLVASDTNGPEEDIFVRDLKAGTTRLVSVSSSGQQGNNNSFFPSISANGRYVAFVSFASNLVSGDTNNADDIFVRDLRSHKTIRASVSSSGQEGNAESFAPSLSGDGRFVAFHSAADNLVAHDTNHATDVFVRDTQGHKTTRVSVSSSGRQGNSYSQNPSISASGRFVAFESNARNLIAHDHNAAMDVFLRDRKRHLTRLVSLSFSGHEGNGASFLVDPAITPDGRFISFISQATNLVPGGTKKTTGEQVFLRDLVAGNTQLLSQSSTGKNANHPSFDPSITSDGRFVVFASLADNLVAHDTNGFVDVFMRGPLR
jgi:Tol biopolymer transport system component